MINNLTYEDVGAAAAVHTHSTSDLTDTLPVSKGGTGASSAAAARAALGITPANIGAASQAQYTATVSTSWSGSGPYTQNVMVSGLLATDTPIVDVVLSAAAETAQAQLEAWGLVGRITAQDNQITVTCYEDKPVTAIPIQLKVVRE